MSRSVKIAVIDDEESILVSTSFLLKILGYDFVTFKGSNEALKYLSSNDDVDIILLDLMMPEIDGYEFLKRVNEKTLEKCKIILHTGVETEGHIQKCIEIGASDFLRKPYSKKELSEVLKRNSSAKRAELHYE